MGLRWLNDASACVLTLSLRVFGSLEQNYSTAGPGISSKILAAAQLHIDHVIHLGQVDSRSAPSWFRPGGLTCGWWAAVNIHIHNKAPVTPTG